MNCQICKSIFPATLNTRAPRRGLFSKFLRWRRNKKGGELSERAGTYAFAFPHIVLVALYRNGLGAKRVLDIAGEPRSAVHRLVDMLKDCGAF